MRKRSFVKFFIATIIVYAINLTYADAHEQSGRVRKLTSNDLIQKLNGKIIFSKNIKGPGGKVGLIIYIKVKNKDYRCINWKYKNSKNINSECSRLIEPAFQVSPKNTYTVPTPSIPPIPTTKGKE